MCHLVLGSLVTPFFNDGSAAEEVVHSSDDPAYHKVAAPADDSKEDRCPACAEKFSTVYDNDTDEWVYTNALRHPETNEIWHYTCMNSSSKSDTNTSTIAATTAAAIANPAAVVAAAVVTPSAATSATTTSMAPTPPPGSGTPLSNLYETVTLSSPAVTPPPPTIFAPITPTLPLDDTSTGANAAATTTPTSPAPSSSSVGSKRTRDELHAGGDGDDDDDDAQQQDVKRARV